MELTFGFIAIGIRKNSKGEIETFGMETSLSDDEQVKDRIESRWGFRPQKLILTKDKEALVTE